MEKDKLAEELVKWASAGNHSCGKMPYGCSINYNPRKKERNILLKFRKTETKGVLSPKEIYIEYPVNYCPFCGKELKKEEIAIGDL